MHGDGEKTDGSREVKEEGEEEVEEWWWKGRVDDDMKTVVGVQT